VTLDQFSNMAIAVRKSVPGQSRRFDRTSTTSGLPPLADIVKEHVSTYQNRLAGMAAFGRAKRTLVDASRVPSSPLSFRSSGQNRFHQLSFCENEVEEHRNAGDTSEVRMRQQAPASRQLRNWAEHAYEIGFGVAQGRGEWPKA
jgi:hypothetical protein